jgi:hypothetical protein
MEKGGGGKIYNEKVLSPASLVGFNEGIKNGVVYVSIGIVQL